MRLDQRDLTQRDVSPDDPLHLRLLYDTFGKEDLMLKNPLPRNADPTHVQTTGSSKIWSSDNKQTIFAAPVPLKPMETNFQVIAEAPAAFTQVNLYKTLLKEVEL